MKNIHVHPKFNKVYEAVVIIDIEGSIGNGRFKAGELVRFCVALTQTGLEIKTNEKLRKWKSASGGQWVLCEDVEEVTAEAFEKQILGDTDQYHVFVLSMETGSDNQLDFLEAKTLFKTTGNIYRDFTPESVVEGVIRRHNDRVW